jgi:hypothetical protein
MPSFDPYIEILFPKLTRGTYLITSPKTITYNCIAWAAHEDIRWWSPMPGYYWPKEVPRELTVERAQEAYATRGYEVCENGMLEEGYEKIAIYQQGGMLTHAARQLPSGKWTSKLGQLQDIQHNTAELLEGSGYGKVESYMRKRVDE